MIQHSKLLSIIKKHKIDIAFYKACKFEYTCVCCDQKKTAGSFQYLIKREVMETILNGKPGARSFAWCDGCATDEDRSSIAYQRYMGNGSDKPKGKDILDILLEEENPMNYDAEDNIFHIGGRK